MTYDIFKDDAIGNPSWIEAVQGLERAMRRMEELAASEESEESDYYLFCAQAGKIVQRRKANPLNQMTGPAINPAE